MFHSFPGETRIFTEKEIDTLKIHLEMDSASEVYDRLRKLFSTNGWVDEPDLVDSLETPLMRLCAYYLFTEKRRGYALDNVGKNKVPLDSLFSVDDKILLNCT